MRQVPGMKRLQDPELLYWKLGVKRTMGVRAPSTPIFSFEIQPKVLEQTAGALLVFWSFSYV